VLSGSLQSNFCLRASHVARLRRCTGSGAGGDCARTADGVERCLLPALPARDHTLLSLNVVIALGLPPQDAAYAGTVHGLFTQLTVSGYVPRAWTLRLSSDAFSLPTSAALMHLPAALQLLLRQTAYASAALAVLNAAPVHLLDGSADPRPPASRPLRLYCLSLRRSTSKRCQRVT
jgi:hypothetical protein